MREVAIEKVAALVAPQLVKGIFLCVPGEAANVMTIGWGGLAYYWRRDVFVVPVRQQRHTYPLLEQAGVFTLSVPHAGAMQRELAQAGTLSGRDGNKFEAMGLKTQPGRTVDVPVVDGCALYLECRVMATNAFDEAHMDPSVVASAYPARDFHTLFYGEILASYAGE